MNRLEEEFRRAAAFGFVTAGLIAEPQLLAISASTASTTEEASSARKYVLWALGEIDTVSPQASQVLLDASSGADHYAYENACVEKLAKATANVALGLMVQRAHRANHGELFSRICQRLATSATKSNDSFSPEDLVREEAALALLLACEAGPERAAAQPRLVHVLRQLASDRESDRYVISYALEALFSLSDESMEARAELEFVLEPRHGEDLRSLLRQRSCSHTSATNPFQAGQSRKALKASVSQLSEGQVTAFG